MIDAANAYIDTWNADGAARTALLERRWSPTAAYTDPLADVAGRSELDALIGAARERFPGAVFALLGEPDAHHGVLRFTWGLGPDGGEPVVVGSDVVELDADGRIDRVIGFIDRAPSA